MTLEVGEPTWTRGHFTRVAAQDDLGIEALGAGLLRELVPGVVQTSISAGYYAYYPFLLDEFERRWPNELRRSEFQPFYRRQEAAFAVACGHHTHRGNLRGINGINAASMAADDAGADGEVDLASLAAPGRYMKTGLGGYGLFYRPALEDIGATRLGRGNTHVDRPTDLGRAAAEGFRAAIEQTEYWHRWADADAVPMAVLSELGEVVCPCGVPGRTDHQPILDTLFLAARDTERWETLRRYRVQSLGLLLEFQALRPTDVTGIGAWRRALISGRIGDSDWSTRFPRHRDAWRAYQHRETLVAALTTIFADMLFVLDEAGAAPLRHLERSIVQKVVWSELPCRASDPFDQLVSEMAPARDRPEELVELAERAMDSAMPASVEQSLTTAIKLLAALAVEPDGDEGFRSLLDRGGEQRLSVSHMSRWLSARARATVEGVAVELTRLLFHRHLQVATAKVTSTDHRDPYCVAEEQDGLYCVIRPDEPFWTGARFDTLNHLLWTAGVLDDPDGDGRPTQLGLSLLDTVPSDG